MLERATACIAKAGARDSLKCAQQQQQTRRASYRLLHQTFWTHGAGDLDLPLPLSRPCLIPATTSCLPLRYDDPQTSAAGRQHSKSATSPPDGVFLDFLYPPQALAYLHQPSKQRIESRTRSDARSSMDSFVPRCRRYSSAPTPRTTNAAYVKEQHTAGEGTAEVHASSRSEDQDFLANDILGEVEDEQERSASHLRKAGLQKLDPAAAKRVLEELVPRKSADDLSKLSSESDEGARDVIAYADSSGELAEQSSHRGGDSEISGHSDTVVLSAEPVERLRQLRHMLATKVRNNTAHHVQQAWRLYLSLPEREREDTRLQEKLLVWLNTREDELADAYIISLYWSIPPQARQLITYSTVAKSFARRSAWDLLFPMHREALRNIANGQELSLELFAMALVSSSWNIVRRVIKDQEKVFRDTEQEHRLELFWVKVNEIPDLLERVPALLRRPRTRFLSNSTIKSSRSEFKTLASRLSKESVQQAMDEILVEKLSFQRLQKLFSLLHLIVQLETDAHVFFHRLLTTLIPALGQHYISQRGPGSNSLRNDAHEVISFMYWYYRQDKAANLHPDLMGIWLRHLTKRMSTTDVERRSSRNVTALMVIEDWEKWHGQVGADAVHNLIAYSAHSGSVKGVRRWIEYLELHFPAYSEQQKAFWAQIYVHARLSNLSAAREAFREVSQSARAHGDWLDIKCWNVLLHAYQAADDLEGAIDAFKELVQDPRLVLDRSSFNPLLNMLSRRGDVDGIEELMQQSDSFTQDKRVTRSVHMHIMALTLVDDVRRAELVLAETLPQVRAGEIIGSLTECFNTLLAKYASMRDLDSTIRTYRRMTQERIRMNATTFQHVMQVLANFRKTSAAWAILTKGMAAAGLKPTAVHYRVAMIGFSNQDEPDKAIMAHEHMLKNNIRQSLETKEALLYAKGLLEKRAHDSARKAGYTVPEALRIALSDLQDTVLNIQARDVAHAGWSSAQDIFKPIMWLLGGEKHLTTVKRLFQESLAVSQNQSRSPWPSMHLSATLMNAMYHAKEHSQVEEYWKLVKDQADATAAPTTIPDFVALREQSSGTSLSARATAQKKTGGAADDRVDVESVTTHSSAVQRQQSETPSESTLLGPRPAPARRHVLSKPFRIYLASLAAQDRIEDALNEATRLLTQGYTFDNITWNRLVEYIAGSDPPLTLLAFTLAERYLIRNFPGWIRRSSQKFHPRKSARRLGLQYIRARYLGQTELMPQYRTFVWLAKALLELRRREAVGWQGDGQGNQLAPNVERFLGTIKQIREKAPRTLRAVETMPRIEDKWQHRLLKGIGWKFPPGGSQDQTIADATLSEMSNATDTRVDVERNAGGGDVTAVGSSTAESTLETSDRSGSMSEKPGRDFNAHEDLDAEGEEDLGPMADPATQSDDNVDHGHRSERTLQ